MALEMAGAPEDSNNRLEMFCEDVPTSRWGAVILPFKNFQGGVLFPIIE